MLLGAEVAAALESGRPVVALESTIIAHGLPRPDNLRVARACEAAVRAAGAVPATIAVVRGEARVGLDEAALGVVAAGAGVTKCGVRDLPAVLAAGGNGATTVAATALLAARAGIRLFATGGLGGVHAGARETWDESADLTTLARTPIGVVCAGVKSILDVAATLERLETLNVTVLGFGTDAFPAFYLPDSGHPAPARVDSPEEAAAVLRARDSLGLPGAVVIANPLEPVDGLTAERHSEVVALGLAAAAREGVRGKAVTPFVLDFMHRETGGASLRANERLVVRNAELAARIAVAA